MFKNFTLSPGTRGILLALIGTALFTPIFAAGKFSDLVVPAFAIVAMRYWGGFLTSAAVVFVGGIKFRSLKSKTPHWHLFRSVLGIGGGLFTIHAATIMPIANASAIGLTEGLIIIALGAILLREQVTYLHWLAGGICAVGALVVLQGTLNIDVHQLSDGNNLEGSISAFLGALFMSSETIMLKILGSREKTMGVLLYVNAFGALLSSIPLYFVLADANISLASVLPFLVLGPLAILAQTCNIHAYRQADVSIIGPIHYSWIIFAALLGIYMFGETPTLWTLGGSGLIVLGGIWLGCISSQQQLRMKRNRLV